MNKGDIVICVDDCEVNNITEGSEYVILKPGETMVKVEDCYGQSAWYYKRRFKEKVMEFEFGQEIEVSTDKVNGWRKRIFIGMTADGEYLCMCKGESCPEANASGVQVTFWKHAQPIPSKMITVNNKEYSEETLQKMIEQYVEKP